MGRPPGALDQVIAEHERILAAIEARDGAAACEALVEHIEDADCASAGVAS